jgi:ketosteroid isomerase-like protein
VDLDQAQQFAREWAAGWNSHDLDRILAHYSADVVFRSPVATQIIDGSDGVVRGIDALRAYWAEGLRRVPDLRFEIIGVYTGVDTVVINYRNQAGQLVCEALTFHDGRITAGMGTYGPRPA